MLYELRRYDVAVSPGRWKELSLRGGWEELPRAAAMFIPRTGPLCCLRAPLPEVGPRPPRYSADNGPSRDFSGPQGNHWTWDEIAPTAPRRERTSLGVRGARMALRRRSQRSGWCPATRRTAALGPPALATPRRRPGSRGSRRDPRPWRSSASARRIAGRPAERVRKWIPAHARSESNRPGR